MSEENFYSEIRKKWAKRFELLTSSATNANLIVAEEDAPPKKEAEINKWPAQNFCFFKKTYGNRKNFKTKILPLWKIILCSSFHFSSWFFYNRFTHNVRMIMFFGSMVRHLLVLRIHLILAAAHMPLLTFRLTMLTASAPAILLLIPL